MKKIFFLLLAGFIPYIYVAGQTDTLRLMFAGDIMAHTPQIEAAWNPSTRQYDFNDSFIFLKHIFAQADFVIGNLETTLGNKPYSGYPRFRAPVALAEALKNAGFNVLVTANNHSADKGKKGIIQTVEALDRIGIWHTGTFVSQEEKDLKTPLILEKKGIKIALLNYTYGTNGLPVSPPAVVNLIDTLQIKKDIAKAREKNPDIIIVFLHWGTQYKSHPDKMQIETEKFLQRHGINIIIGSHPHVVQPVRIRQNQITVYSLGNFISNQRTYPRDGSIIFYLELIKEKNQIKIVEAGYIPVWTYKYKLHEKWHFEVLPVDDFIRDRYYFEDFYDFKKMLKLNLYLNHILRQPGSKLKRGLKFMPRYPVKTIQPVLEFHIKKEAGLPQNPLPRLMDKRRKNG